MGHFRTRGGARQLCERGCRRELAAIRGSRASQAGRGPPGRALHQPDNETPGTDHVMAKARESCCRRVRGRAVRGALPFTR